MRIVSLNAWGGALFEELSAWLPSCGADVLCLQETTRTPTVAGWTTFGDGVRTLPQRADLFDDVQALLPNHWGRFDASDAGPVLVEGAATQRQEFGLGVFVDKQLPVVRSHSQFVHGQFTVHDAWPSDDRPRIAQAVRVAAGPSRYLTVVQVHGLRNGAGKHDTPARLAQASALAAFLEAVSEPDDVKVLCGDLNVLPSSETFDILGASGLVDLVGLADTRTSRYLKPVRHASYLFVSDPGAVAGFQIMQQPEVSDHRALVLDI